jgi:hypothetical protein
VSERLIADSLDPAQYASHVTRTAILLEQLARDVSALREESERNAKGSNGLREQVAIQDRDFLVFKEATNGRISANEIALRDLTERLKWLGRLVIGTLITGIISGMIAILFKTVGKF